MHTFHFCLCLNFFCHVVIYIHWGCRIDWYSLTFLFDCNITLEKACFSKPTFSLRVHYLRNILNWTPYPKSILKKRIPGLHWTQGDLRTWVGPLRIGNLLGSFLKKISKYHFFWVWKPPKPCKHIHISCFKVSAMLCHINFYILLMSGSGIIIDD